MSAVCYGAVLAAVLLRRQSRPGRGGAIRTLKEQVVWGRIFRNAEEVRAAVRAFVARYNEHWLLEKNAYRSPAQTRREWFAAPAPIRAAA
jgi:hypothetical protein